MPPAASRLREEASPSPDKDDEAEQLPREDDAIEEEIGMVSGDTGTEPDSELVRSLTFFDGFCVIVGVIIGTPNSLSRQ